jgi:hypothetical protein
MIGNARHSRRARRKVFSHCGVVICRITRNGARPGIILCVTERRNASEVPTDPIAICVIAALYLLNNQIFKQNTAGALGDFLTCYFNDLMAPICLLAYSNILLGTRGKRLCRIGHILLFCLCAGLVWEFLAPLINAGSVTDPADIAAYLSGGSLYWIIEKIRTRKNDLSTEH